MSIPAYDLGLPSGLLLGVLFGYVLEAAGFGSPRKLTAQFSLRDFAVFKVMFTAVLVAAVGLYLLRLNGWLTVDAIFTPTTFLWAILAGGALIGVGFAIGGYCPGTGVVGIASGRLDAIVFLVGMLIGTAVFAVFYEPMLGFYLAGKGPDAQRLPELLGMSEAAILGALVAIAALGFWLGSKLERARGGPLTAQEVTAPAPESTGAPGPVVGDTMKA
jgi:hypothetical protein